MKSTCEEISDKLSGFVDGEIGAAALEDIAAHLERCPDCRDKENTQRAVKAVLSNPELRQAPPHDVRARIMRAVERQPEGFSFGALVQRLFEFQPLPAFASVVVVIGLSAILAFWGGKTMFTNNTAEEPLALLMNAQMEGEVVCIDCELLNISKTPYVHDDNHRLGLRCKDGHFWNILQTSKGSELSSVGHLMHRRIIVKGHIFPTQHLVEVTEYTVI